MDLIKKWWFWIILVVLLFAVVYFLISKFASPEEYLSQGEVVTVGPNKVDCYTLVPTKCLIINGERSYESINGFEYEEGYSYVLDVDITRIENSPADTSSLKYDLIKVISKTKA